MILYTMKRTLHQDTSIHNIHSIALLTSIHSTTILVPEIHDYSGFIRLIDCLFVSYYV